MTSAECSAGSESAPQQRSKSTFSQPWAVERLLERADAVEFFEESVEEIERAEDEQGQSDEP
jgi:hypothetical protein